MSKGQVRFMQHLARNSARLAVSGLGVDRDLDKKLKGGSSGKKRHTPASKDSRSRGLAAHGITKLHIRALRELERHIRTGLLADPPSVTSAAVTVLAKWFTLASGSKARQLLYPDMTVKERTDALKALNGWLDANKGLKREVKRATVILAGGKFGVPKHALPTVPRNTAGLELAAWWIRTAFIRAVAEVKGNGWARMPPRPDMLLDVALPEPDTMGSAPDVLDGDTWGDATALPEGEGGGAEESESEETPRKTEPIERLVPAEYERLKTERANAEHARVVAALMDYLEALGWLTKAEVDWIDVLGTRGDDEAICEVKSIITDNESDQVRAGVAQLFEYRWRTRRPSASLWLVLSARPARMWLGDYLETIGIGLLWIAQDGLLDGPGVLEAIDAGRG